MGLIFIQPQQSPPGKPTALTYFKNYFAGEGNVLFAILYFAVAIIILQILYFAVAIVVLQTQVSLLLIQPYHQAPDFSNLEL